MGGDRADALGSPTDGNSSRPTVFSDASKGTQLFVKLSALNNLPGRQEAAKMHADDETLIAPATFAP